MATFSADVFQNEHLSDGATDAHAIVTMTCEGAGAAGGAPTDGGSGGAAEIIIIDSSGSMSGPTMRSAIEAAHVALDAILDGTWFAVVTGSHVAAQVFPYQDAPRAMVQMDPAARAEAKRAASRLTADGGTAIGTWLRLAGSIVNAVPEATQRHAILLTDGKNESESEQALDAAIDAVTGVFQCDARGVGAHWQVQELRKISTALLGTVDLIAEPNEIAADFQQLVQASMARGVADAQLRVWAPQGAEVLFVRQVAPTVEDLTRRRTAVNALTSAYPTGAWGDESRDYHVAVRVGSKPVGAEQLVARVQLVVGDEVMANGLVKARWSDDDALTTRINPEVAHYTGQTELAEAIQEGLAAKAAGDEATATVKLGRAVQLAQATGNDEATSKLRKVVEVDDAEQGTVRLRRNTDKLDEMALDTASTKTSRVRR